MKRFIFYILVLIMMLMTGCGGLMTQVQERLGSGSEQAKGEVIELPERVLFNRNDLPGDVELVMAAMINMIRGGDKVIPNIGFDPEGRHELLDDPFSYAGFDVKYVDIIYYKTERPRDNVRFALLEGCFYFADAIGRSAYVRFLAEYAVSGKDIIIASSEYEILPNPHPKVKAFILPKDVVKNAPPKVKNSFIGLYLMANQKAITMEPIRKENVLYEEFEQMSFIDRLKYKSDAVPAEYCVLVFCMERLRPESRFVLTVSGDKRASASSLSEPLYMNDNGWLIGTVAGEFAVDAYNKEVFFHVQFNPGIDPENNKLRHICRFSSLKNYHSDRIKKPENPYEKAFLQTLTEEVFLNPAVTKNARLIQKRLAELGFYTMKIDGAFGKGSRRALKAFKQANGLGNNSKWDIRTQKALFKGSRL